MPAESSRPLTTRASDSCSESNTLTSFSLGLGRSVGGVEPELSAISPPLASLRGKRPQSQGVAAASDCNSLGRFGAGWGTGPERWPFGAVAFPPQCRENEGNRSEDGPPPLGPIRRRFAGGALRQAPVGGSMENGNRGGQEGTAHETQEEAKKIRRLQVMISMVSSVIGQDPNLTVEEASELVAGAKRAALAMFPDKELAFDILYKPRLQRLMKERFRIQ